MTSKPFTDRVSLSGTRRTADGYLVTEARVARGGNIQDYLGAEIGEGEPGQVLRIYRPEDEIFRADSLATFAHKPVTLEHPKDNVSPATWKAQAIGHLGSEVIRDGEFVRVPLVIMDGAAIAGIEAGKREISMGYDCELVMQAGTTADGRAYDGFQRNIRINHCAVVDAGRAGPQCRIGDRLRHQQQEGTSTMKTVTVDGKKLEVADDVAAVIEGLQAKTSALGDVVKEAEKVIPGATQALVDVKAKLAETEKQLSDAVAKAADLEKKVPTADQLVKMANDRAALIDAAKKIKADVETGDKSAADIRKAVVAAKMGDEAVKDRSDDYVAAVFDMLAKQAGEGDPIRDAARGEGGAKKVTGRDAYLANLNAAWQQ